MRLAFRATSLLAFRGRAGIFRLGKRVLKRFVIQRPSWCERLRDGYRPRLGTVASRRSHVVGLDFDRCDAEWVPSQMPITAFVRELPVERGIESNEHQRTGLGSEASRP